MRIKNIAKRPSSLAFRVTVLVGITIFVCLTFISLMVQQSIAQHFAEQDADELNEVFLAVKRKLHEAYHEGVSPSSILFQAVSGHHGVYYLVKNKAEEIVFSSESAALEKYPGDTYEIEHISPSHLSLFFDGEHMLRATGIIVPIDAAQTQYQVIVASNMEFHMNYMEAFEKTLWGIIVLSGAITILVARFAVYRGHSPLRRLSRNIGSITADKLDIRLDPNEVPVELANLVGSFNAMIERLESGFEQLSHFSADIAHELRTPITNLTTQTQVILNKPRSTDEYIEILYSNLEEYERMTKMVSDMLLLAQTEHGLIKPKAELIDCGKEIGELVEYFELLAHEKHISIKRLGNNIKLMCDKSMFRQALSNLLSNAIRYAPENASVTVSMQSRDGEAHISISNPSIRIPEAQLSRLFDRFYRTDPSRKRDGQGAGLGLTIARSVLEVNGAFIRVESNDQKTTFTVVFTLNS
ncbi:heavy metal sensor histidine kinase [Alteromonas oceanisediminis]|uniref:heavy metal sensor histidine kinase n=1 Tax=Alteromonas oceanisediminis TaxID=2836180 RepID=UPI001BD9D186|nr:heavy metal sensor histidine kinase [Alteromonas oceanisediminis]MBT0587026.1 heavy metal sensor histidine kinase [Alteromonas oceanisediminis]